MMNHRFERTRNGAALVILLGVVLYGCGSDEPDEKKGADVSFGVGVDDAGVAVGATGATLGNNAGVVVTIAAGVLPDHVKVLIRESEYSASQLLSKHPGHDISSRLWAIDPLDAPLAASVTVMLPTTLGAVAPFKPIWKGKGWLTSDSVDSSQFLEGTPTGENQFVRFNTYDFGMFAVLTPVTPPKCADGDNVCSPGCSATNDSDCCANGKAVFGQPTANRTVDNRAGGVTAIAHGDVTGDGKTDIVAALGVARRIAFYPGKGLGEFDSSKLVATETAADAIAVADVVGDGHLDVVAAVEGRGIVGYRNTGKGVFAREVMLAAAVDAENMAVADLDGDGRVDLLFNDGRHARYARGLKGGAGFGAATTIWKGSLAAANVAVAFATADLDGDGDRDVVMSRYALLGTGSTVAYSLVDKSGMPGKPVVTDHRTGRVAGLAIGDIDGDKRADLVAVDSAADRVLWYAGKASDDGDGSGFGGFKTGDDLVAEAIDGRSVAVANWDADSAAEVIVGVVSNSFQGAYLFKKAKNGFDKYVAASVPSGIGHVVVADFSEDGRTDIAWASVNGRVGLVVQNTTCSCETTGDCPATYDPGCASAKCVNNKCVVTPKSGSGCCASASECKDNDVCTAAPQCLGFKCHFPAIGGCCTSASDCPDDGKTCTSTACTSNKCKTSPIAGCCSDDTECVDGNVCSKDICKANTCDHEPIAGCCSKHQDCVDPGMCYSGLCSGSNECAYGPMATAACVAGGYCSGLVGCEQKCADGDGKGVCTCRDGFKSTRLDGAASWLQQPFHTDTRRAAVSMLQTTCGAYKAQVDSGGKTKALATALGASSCAGALKQCDGSVRGCATPPDKSVLSGRTASWRWRIDGKTSWTLTTTVEKHVAGAAGRCINILTRGSSTHVVRSDWVSATAAESWLTRQTPPVLADLKADGKLDYIGRCGETSFIGHDVFTKPETNLEELKIGLAKPKATDVWRLKVWDQDYIAGDEVWLFTNEPSAQKLHWTKNGLKATKSAVQAWDGVAIQLNGDGRPDLVLASKAGGLTLRVTTEENVGVFAPTKAPKNTWHKLVSGRINADKTQDILAFDSQGSGTIAWFANNGDGTLTQQSVDNSNNKGVKSVDLGDINADGHLDVVIAEETDVYVMLNDGKGVFKARQPLAPKLDSAASALIKKAAFDDVDVSDVDDDGDQDVQLRHAGMNKDQPFPFTVLENLGACCNSDADCPSTACLVGECAVGKCSYKAVDADGDGAAATTCGGGDCNDKDAKIHPGANDLPGDTLDNDCDGVTDEGYCAQTSDCTEAKGECIEAFTCKPNVLPGCVPTVKVGHECGADPKSCTLGRCSVEATCVKTAGKCYDDNKCVISKCSAGKCTYTPTNPTGGCSDGTACTNQDSCSQGACKGKSVAPKPIGCAPFLNAHLALHLQAAGAAQLAGPGGVVTQWPSLSTPNKFYPAAKFELLSKGAAPAGLATVIAKSHQGVDFAHASGMSAQVKVDPNVNNWGTTLVMVLRAGPSESGGILVNHESATSQESYQNGYGWGLRQDGTGNLTAYGYSIGVDNKVYPAMKTDPPIKLENGNSYIVTLRFKSPSVSLVVRGMDNKIRTAFAGSYSTTVYKGAMQIGGSGKAGSRSRAVIGEVLFYDRPLSDEQIKQMSIRTGANWGFPDACHVSGGKPKCSDTDPCTADQCDPYTGKCSFPKVAGKPCASDNNKCTADVCKVGTCYGAVNCDDGNACTADACDKATGCTNKSIEGNPCDDGNKCTLHDKCAHSKCVAGKQKDCDDGNPCTWNFCNFGNCSNSWKNNTACDDGDKCTDNDRCQIGTCQGTPKSCGSPKSHKTLTFDGDAKKGLTPAQGNVHKSGWMRQDGVEVSWNLPYTYSAEGYNFNKDSDPDKEFWYKNAASGNKLTVRLTDDSAFRFVSVKLSGCANSLSFTGHKKTGGTVAYATSAQGNPVERKMPATFTNLSKVVIDVKNTTNASGFPYTCLFFDDFKLSTELVVPVCRGTYGCSQQTGQCTWLDKPDGAPCAQKTACPISQCASGKCSSTSCAFLVNSANDASDGTCDATHCSLREAIAAANLTTKHDTIAFSKDIHITPSSALPQVTKPLTIIGGGRKVVLDGGTTRRVLEASSDLTLKGVTVQNGRTAGGSTAGGIYVSSGKAVFEDVMFLNNTAGLRGGALHTKGQLTVTRCTFKGNTVTDSNGTTGGAVFVEGTTTITSSTFEANTATVYGGALVVWGSSQSVTVRGCSFLSNKAKTGGAFVSWGTVTFVNTTFYDNTATDDGGAINNAGTVSLMNCTVDRNSSPGFSGLATSGTAHLFNTIFSKYSWNSSKLCGANGNGKIASSVKNLVYDGTCGAALTGSPGLGKLGHHGGHTKTVVPSITSAAIGAGDAATCAGALVNKVDQRGVARPQGKGCDIGAVEVKF